MCFITELPPSAAQHLPGQEKESEKESGFIPPAPPLPPSTFAITLPTEITFRKTNTANNAPFSLESDHQEQQFDIQGRPILPGGSGERKGSLGMTLLTKEAQEILKISEELADFGKSHGESSNKSQQDLVAQQSSSEGIKPERKECDSLKAGGNDSMDLCMEDSHSIQSLHSMVQQPASHNILLRAESMDISSTGREQHFPGIITLVKPANGEQSITELLTEDLEFPMDTEYSDWLESFSSDIANNFAGKTDESSSNKMVLGNKEGPSHHLGNDQFGSLTSNDLFSHRDPLLSSKSSTRLTATITNNHNNILDNCSLNLVDNNVLMDIDTETDLGRRKDGHHHLNHHHHHTPSAIDVNVNDLWDFSF